MKSALRRTSPTVKLCVAIGALMKKKDPKHPSQFMSRYSLSLLFIRYVVRIKSKLNGKHTLLVGHPSCIGLYINDATVGIPKKNRVQVNVKLEEGIDDDQSEELSSPTYVCYRALRNITAGEVLWADYGDSYWKDGGVREEQGEQKEESVIVEEQGEQKEETVIVEEQVEDGQNEESVNVEDQVEEEVRVEQEEKSVIIEDGVDSMDEDQSDVEVTVEQRVAADQVGENRVVVEVQGNGGEEMIEDLLPPGADVLDVPSPRQPQWEDVVVPQGVDVQDPANRLPPQWSWDPRQTATQAFADPSGWEGSTTMEMWVDDMMRARRLMEVYGYPAHDYHRQ